METEHYVGKYKTYLHNEKLSAYYKKEKEYLIGWVKWIVKKVQEETLTYNSKSFKATVIYLISM